MVSFGKIQFIIYKYILLHYLEYSTLKSFAWTIMQLGRCSSETFWQIYSVSAYDSKSKWKKILGTCD